MDQGDDGSIAMEACVARLRSRPEAVAAALGGQPMAVAVTVLAAEPRTTTVLLTRDGHVVCPSSAEPDVEMSGTPGELADLAEGRETLRGLAGRGALVVRDPAAAAGRLEAVLELLPHSCT